VPRTAPNGQRFVFNANRLSGKGDDTNGLWIRDLSARGARFLSGSSDYLGNTRAPFWSPDSQNHCVLRDSRFRVRPGTTQEDKGRWKSRRSDRRHL
jgi:hypothetical protein